MELLRACQQLEAAAADVTRCKGLEQRLQVKLGTIPVHLWYLSRPCKAVSAELAMRLVRAQSC